MPEIAAASVEVREPAYSAYIPPMQSRRMSKGLKMGLTAALDCLQTAGISPEQLKAIEVGTSYGLLKDSETFLDNMIVHQESALTPTAFIQSTHNTVSGAIALSLKSHVHNMTFSQKGHSFESALTDAELALAGDETDYVLLGAVEEKVATLEWLVQHKVAEGLQVGEGASFLLISNKPDNAICRLSHNKIFKTRNPDVASEQLKQIIAEHSWQKRGQCPVVIWNSLNPGILNYTSNIMDISGIVGYNPTGAAQALVIGAKTCQQQQCPVIVVNQFDEYWSVFELNQA